jgi:hypothetical protein
MGITENYRNHSRSFVTATRGNQNNVILEFGLEQLQLQQKQMLVVRKDRNRKQERGCVWLRKSKIKKTSKQQDIRERDRKTKGQTNSYRLRIDRQKAERERERNSKTTGQRNKKRKI